MVGDDNLAVVGGSRMAGLRTVMVPIVLLALQFVGSGILLPYYAFARQDSLQLRGFAVALALFGLWTMYVVWVRKPWAVWAVLTLVSVKLTVDLFNWSLDLDRSLLWLSGLINVGIITWAFRQSVPASTQVTRAQRIFFGCVLALAAWVAVWGILLPAFVNKAIPFMVPPLHARFLGVMYLSGATFMALGLAAREWDEMRITVPMIAIWTGMLGIVSLFHLEAFDWSLRPTWIWFMAYTAFPIIAAWIVWQQRAQRPSVAGARLSPGLRRYLWTQGALVTVLAVSLLAAPGLMTRVWPWTITPLLAHLYAAPFLSYGLGSLYAARQRGWAAARIPVLATLVFTLGVLLASLRHATLFAPGAPATWLWFGGFGLATSALTLFAGIPVLRVQPRADSEKSPSALPRIDEKRT